MKKSTENYILLSLLLILASGVFYYIHFLLFHDAHHIFIYLVGDIAFVPIEVLLVTLIIHKLLEEREKRAMLNKLNMVIGAFFSEVGTELLKSFRYFEKDSEGLGEQLDIDNKWTAEQFDEVGARLRQTDIEVDADRGDLVKLKELLTGKRDFMVRLLENPNLLEHESFTDMLWGIFHLGDELASRKDLGELYPADSKHLSGDIKRAYNRLIDQWVSHMEHLKLNYPYLFSLAVRRNPFNKHARVEVTSS